MPAILPNTVKHCSYIQLGEQQKPQSSLLSVSKATTQYHLSLKENTGDKKAGEAHRWYQMPPPSSQGRGQFGKRKPQVLCEPKSPSWQSISLTPLLSVFLSFSPFLKRLETQGKPLSHPLLCSNLCLWGRKMAK